MPPNVVPSHRETVGDAFGDGDDVRTDIEPLVGEELTAAPIAALDLVADQNRAILLASSCQALGKLLGGELDAAHALNALQDDGTDVALLQFSLPGRQVVQRQVGHVAVVVDGGDDLGLLVTSTASEVRP